ncbi:MAG: hypothetical protein NVS9B10_23200 [Nevskia sp.]
MAELTGFSGAGVHPGNRRLAQATRTLAQLDEQAAELRVELANLRRTLAAVVADTGTAGAVDLPDAHERLVQSARHAQTLAERAASRLAQLARSAQLHALSDTPSRALPAASDEFAADGNQSSLQVLRDANEQLLIAALSAQEQEAHSEGARNRQVKFLAMVAHELRSPLAPIGTAAELMDRGGNNEPLLARLQVIIRRQVAHMSRLVDDLLDSSRVSAGKFSLEPHMIELADVLTIAIETSRPKIDARRQRLSLQLPEGALSVHGDPLRLAQVFGNLLDNACKYTPEAGEIDIRVMRLDASLTINISDTGIGISAGALPHIFGLFVQDSMARTHARGGLGIGLAVVRELVEAHGGSVTAASAGSGHGSEFVVTLPMPGSPAGIPIR